MTIDFKTTKPGDLLRIVGAGAPGFAKLGEIVEVTECNGTNRCDVKREDGETAYFALTCGAARLEPVEADDAAAILANGPHDHDHVVKSRDVDNTEVVNSEELIRGMTEMAGRFTARMDAAGAQIDELRECLILAVKELDAIPATTPYTKTICARARQALGLT